MYIKFILIHVRLAGMAPTKDDVFASLKLIWLNIEKNWSLLYQYVL